jgi:hypothetical protein
LQFCSGLTPGVCLRVGGPYQDDQDGMRQCKCGSGREELATPRDEARDGDGCREASGHEGPAAEPLESRASLRA